MFQSVFNVLGETLARLHQDEEAERWYQAALNAQPDHVPAHITYGKLLAKNVSKKLIFLYVLYVKPLYRESISFNLFIKIDIKYS